MGNVHVYYEDGPLKGEVHERQDAPTKIMLQTAKLPGRSFVADLTDGDPPPPDGYMDIVTIEYERFPLEYRHGCVSYFNNEDEFQAAWREVTADYAHDEH